MRWCDKGGGAKKRAAGEVVVVVVVDMGKKSSFSTIKWSPILVLIVLTGVGVIDLILRPLTSWLLSSAWNGDDNRRAYDTTEVPIMVRENHTHIYIYGNASSCVARTRSRHGCKGGDVYATRT